MQAVSGMFGTQRSKSFAGHRSLGADLGPIQDLLWKDYRGDDHRELHVGASLVGGNDRRRKTIHNRTKCAPESDTSSISSGEDQSAILRVFHLISIRLYSKLIILLQESIQRRNSRVVFHFYSLEAEGYHTSLTGASIECHRGNGLPNGS